jgi:hypothetical protein
VSYFVDGASLRFNVHVYRKEKVKKLEGCYVITNIIISVGYVKTISVIRLYNLSDTTIAVAARSDRLRPLEAWMSLCR